MTEPTNPIPGLDILPDCSLLVDRAVELFSQGIDCQEAVIRTFGEALSLDLELDNEPKPKRRGGLAASGICGALIGATSVLLSALAEGDERTTTYTLELMKGFREKYGTTTCQYLTRHMKWGDYHTFCVGYVRSAVEILHRVLTTLSSTPVGRS
ncbi:MAG: C-GCAxxG-C-C family protein [Deltaproteobacteria bacterium]|jgi:C_GCAxxG_C_C family probable redox protein|nr:C-GCAxxG-C-C family protein [Deltaproteobacteria bacterium]